MHENIMIREKINLVCLLEKYSLQIPALSEKSIVRSLFLLNDRVVRARHLLWHIYPCPAFELSWEGSVCIQICLVYSSCSLHNKPSANYGPSWVVIYGNDYGTCLHTFCILRIFFPTNSLIILQVVLMWNGKNASEKLSKKSAYLKVVYTIVMPWIVYVKKLRQDVCRFSLLP